MTCELKLNRHINDEDELDLMDCLNQVVLYFAHYGTVEQQEINRAVKWLYDKNMGVEVDQ